MDKEKIDLVLDTCLTAGKIMIESGSEMYRVEDTMHRIIKNAGIDDARVYTTPTGLFVGLDKTNNVQIEEVGERGINLEKVTLVNDLSRKYGEKKITLEEFNQLLAQTEKDTRAYPLWLQMLGTGILSATLMVLFMNDYNVWDFVFSWIIGTIGFLTYYFVKKFTNIKFLSEMLAAIVLAFLAVSLKIFVPSTDSDAIIVGGVMVLVPGLALTNSLRDLFAGHLISGMTRGMEAILTAIALGGGVGIVIKFMGVM